MIDENNIDTEWHNLLFGVRRSVRYHDRRVRFFDFIRKGISILTLLSGSGAIITAIALAGTAYIIIASATVAILSAIDLIFDPAGYARLHNDLKRRFINLESEMTLEGKSQSNINRLTSTRLAIEADEPPVLRILDIICHNEMLRSMGYDRSHFISITPMQRFFSHFANLGADKIN